MSMPAGIAKLHNVAAIDSRPIRSPHDERRDETVGVKHRVLQSGDIRFSLTLMVREITAATPPYRANRFSKCMPRSARPCRHSPPSGRPSMTTPDLAEARAFLMRNSSKSTVASKRRNKTILIMIPINLSSVRTVALQLRPDRIESHCKNSPRASCCGAIVPRFAARPVIFILGASPVGAESKNGVATTSPVW